MKFLRANFRKVSLIVPRVVGFVPPLLQALLTSIVLFRGSNHLSSLVSNRVAKKLWGKDLLCNRYHSFSNSKRLVLKRIKLS